jgi:hypothetical protein
VLEGISRALATAGNGLMRASGAVPEAASAAAGAAPVIEAIIREAPKSGGSAFALLGGTAGVLGVGATLLNTWQDSTKGTSPGASLFSMSYSIGAMAIGGTVMGLSTRFGGGARNAVQAGGAALLLGGVASAFAGVYQRLAVSSTDRTAADNLLQHAQTFVTGLPDTPAGLEGMAMAYGEPITTDHKLQDVAIYIDPTSAKAVPKGTVLGTAIGLAHARAQEDDQDRSFAVIQTKDGAYWTARLSGDLDQVDGRNYADKTNNYAPFFSPLIGKHQAALQAISGIESVYTFPKGTEPTEAAQPAGDVPWIDPVLPAPSATPSASPSPIATAGAGSH